MLMLTHVMGIKVDVVEATKRKEPIQSICFSFCIKLPGLYCSFKKSGIMT